MTERADVFERLSLERERQLTKWGIQYHPASYWMLILVEEIGELGAALLQGRPVDAKKELVQVGAVCIAWLETWGIE